MDSINRKDPDEQMKTRLKEDFNFIQLIARSTLSRFLNLADPTRAGSRLFRWLRSPQSSGSSHNASAGLLKGLYDPCILVSIV